MVALAFLLATLQLVLVGCGVTVVGTSELDNLAFGIALIGLGLTLGALPANWRGPVG